MRFLYRIYLPIVPAWTTYEPTYLLATSPLRCECVRCQPEQSGSDCTSPSLDEVRLTAPCSVLVLCPRTTSVRPVATFRPFAIFSFRSEYSEMAMSTAEVSCTACDEHPVPSHGAALHLDDMSS
eukprot:6203002-Pleurochrysis_carterae.AAC.2